MGPCDPEEFPMALDHWQTDLEKVPMNNRRLSHKTTRTDSILAFGMYSTPQIVAMTGSFRDRSNQ